MGDVERCRKPVSGKGQEVRLPSELKLGLQLLKETRGSWVAWVDS